MSGFHIFQVNAHFTLRCNLKCKLCTSYSPYYDNPYMLSYDECCKLLDRFFEVFDTCGAFLILGGEPLVHKEMPRILDYLYKFLPQITKVVRFNTNGSILVSDELVQASQKFGDKIHFLVNDYGDHLSTQKDACIEKLTQAGVGCEIRDYVRDPFCGGWVDFTDMTTVKNTPAEADALFYKCLCAPWRQERSVNLYDGEMFICGQSKRAMELGVIPKVKPEYVDIFEHGSDIAKVRAEIDRFMQQKSHTGCQYCTGICPDSVRYAAAEQLE